IGEKSIVLTEAGFYSKAGRKTTKRDIRDIATINPGESFTTDYDLENIGAAADSITAYFAKDSLGKEYIHKLKVPIATQLKNTVILERLRDFGWNWSMINNKLARSFDRFENEKEEILNKFEKKMDKLKLEEEANKIEHEKWKRHYEETGEEHPDFKAFIEKISKEHREKSKED
ncbi:MAG: hypothetical protein ACXAEL_15260, partial [Candidatus Hodarchaeales archaeon]